MNSCSCKAGDYKLSADILENEMTKGSLIWYSFHPSSKILGINLPIGATLFLKEEGHSLTEIKSEELLEPDFQSLHCKEYDYVIMIEVLERQESPNTFLNKVSMLLKEEGVLLLGMDNRLGLRYFCGDEDPYVDAAFVGLENYIEVDHHSFSLCGGRNFTKAEMIRFLEQAGFVCHRFYSVLPDLYRTQLVYAQGYLPKESLGTRYIPMYRNPNGILVDEKRVYDALIDNGMFHEMANSYLFECSRCQLEESDLQHVTLSLDRGPEQALATVIRKEQVEKRALYPIGKEKIKRLAEQDDYLRKHGVPVVESEYVDGVYRMPYIDAPVASVYLQELLLEDKELFIKRMDEFYDLILHSSDVVGESDLGLILERGYVDLVPLNCFWKDDQYLVYDQEFYEPNFPAKVMMLRTLIIVYDDDPTRNGILPRDFFFDRYQLWDHLEELSRLERQFIVNLRHLDILSEFHNKNQISMAEIQENRKDIGLHRQERNEQKKMENKQDIEKQKEELQLQVNEMTEKYQKAVSGLYEQYREHCFDGMVDKKIFVFGSGKFADKFLAFYHSDYVIEGILDNDSSKWGTVIDGLVVSSPEILRSINETCKVIVCVKNCEDILMQLRGMGIKDIGVYDGNYIYPGRQKNFPTDRNQGSLSKKYHIGYVSGVFDLYHIGHINMFRRAKEQCDYLIAAVTSDEYVRNHKKREPFIPFEERMQVVGACKYVDEVVGVPYRYAGTVEAFQKYHFDCQFCGSDYADNSWWLEQKAWLEQHGSALEFFPYTQQTNSTKIKELINKGLV